MKKSISLISIIFVATGCASITTEQKLSSYEKYCVPYLNTVIDKKVGEDTSPDLRAKWESIIFKDYKIATDANNSEEVRDNAISNASLMCDVQKRLDIE